MKDEGDFIDTLDSAYTETGTGRQGDGEITDSPSRLPFTHSGHRRRCRSVSQHRSKGTVITADLLVEDIDFRRTTTPPYLLGHKALAVSLSDIAAMGSRPLWSIISIGVPEEVWETDFVERLYDGLLELANRYGVQLIGGDTSRTPENIVIDSVVVGECAAGKSIMRTGATAGDHLRNRFTRSCGCWSAAYRTRRSPCRAKPRR